MKKIKFVLAAAFAIAAAGTVSAQSLSDIQAKMKEAAAATGARDYAKAIELFEEVIDQGLDVDGAAPFVAAAKNTLPEVIFRTGLQSAQNGNMDDALTTFAAAADLAELYGNPTVLNNARTYIGRVVLQQGADAFNSKDYATAAAIFQRGYDANPNDMEVALNLAQSYSGMKDFEHSGDIYEDILSLEGRDPRFDEAVATAKANFTLDNLQWASESAQSGNYGEAVTILDEMLTVLPGEPQALMTRLQAYNNMKNYTRITELGDETIAAQTDPEQVAAANYLVGIAYNNLGDAPNSMKYLARVTTGPYAPTAKTIIPELQKVIDAQK